MDHVSNLCPVMFFLNAPKTNGTDQFWLIFQRNGPGDPFIIGETFFYFLNQESKDRSFQTMDEYRTQRDRFLATYTTCVGRK